ncbi:hypothetical protein D3C77_801490 [compost metagenome]
MMCWVNHGAHMTLVNDLGEVAGLLKPFDDKILANQLKSFYESPSAFKTDGYKMLDQKNRNLKVS